MNAAVVTDSTSDLTPAYARERGIDVVPLFVNFGDRRYRDNVDLSHAEFYERMALERELPTTSQPTAAMFADAFAPHVGAGRPIVGVFISAKLSGTINAARAAAQTFPGADIHLVDSQSASMGVGLLALLAADLARGGANADTIVADLEARRERQRGYAIIPDLSHVARTGRIGRAAALFGGALRIVPIITFSAGEVTEAARVRTLARAQTSLVDLALANIGDVAAARIAVIHANAPELAQALFEQLRARLDREPVYFETIEAGPTIAVHAGPGAAGIFTLPG